MFTTIVNLINFSNFEIEILIYLNVKYKKLNVYVNVKFNSMFRVGNPGHWSYTAFATLNCIRDSGQHLLIKPPSLPSLSFDKSGVFLRLKTSGLASKRHTIRTQVQISPGGSYLTWGISC